MDYRLRQDAEKKLQAEQGAPRHVINKGVAVVLVYPNTYYVGMSNLGFQAIYGFVNDWEQGFCERAFLPDAALLPIYERTHTPVCSLESQTALADFDIVAFSVSFENDYLNILKILELSGIPLTSEKRQADDPLLLLGGAVTTINPEPLAMFFDICVIGDGEPILADLLGLYSEQFSLLTKHDFLQRAASVPGVYIPALYQVEYAPAGQIARFSPFPDVPETVIPQPLTDLSRYPASSRILTEQTEFAQLFLLQINRGCCYRCRFCHTGYTQCPLRHLPLETAVELAQQGLRYRNRIGLVGAAIADYPDLQTLCQTITELGGSISASSLRMSALSRSETALEPFLRDAQRSITLAPEAGTERLRRVAGKALSDEVLLDMLERIVTAQAGNVKLYFLIGLPTETDEDIDGIIQLCQRCKEFMLQPAKRLGKIGTLTVSVNPCVPKPFTPFQWYAMETETALKRKLQRIKRALQRVGNVEVIHEAPRWAVWQGILARGDRRVGQILIKTLQYQGNWKKAFRALHISPDFYVHRERDCDEYFPWNHLQIGISRQRLWTEYQSIFQGQGARNEGEPESAPP